MTQTLESPVKGLEMTHRLFERLKSTYAYDPVQYDTYYGSLISAAVYEFDYAQLGTLLGELFILWEDGPLFERPIDGLDGHNGFEEFVCHVLDYQLQAYGVIADETPHMDRLDTLWQALVAREENDWDTFKAMKASLLEEAS